MIISKTKKFVFFHNPKAAGSSITLSLAPYSTKWKGKHESSFNRGWQSKFHHDNKQHAKMSETKYHDFNSYYKFAFVRNPWEMVLSFYEKTKHRHRIKTFDAFLESPFYLNTGALKFIQSQYLDRPLDYIGKYENLKNDWKKIRSKIDINDDLQHVNKKGSVDWNFYRAFYTPEQRDKVAKRYKRDIDLYDYDF